MLWSNIFAGLLVVKSDKNELDFEGIPKAAALLLAREVNPPPAEVLLFNYI